MNKDFAHDNDLKRLLNDSEPNVDDFYNYYQNNPKSFMLLIPKICQFNGFNHLLNIIRKESDLIQNNHEILSSLIANLTPFLQNLYHSHIIEPLIEIFINFHDNITKPFEKFLVLQFVSSLVSLNKAFPSKKDALNFFISLSKFFKQSNKIMNYFTCLYFINELEEIEISEAELNFYKECISIARDPICEDLFCGFRIPEFEKIFANKKFTSKDFITDTFWKKLVDSQAKNSTIDFEIEFISFLNQIDVEYKIVENSIVIGKYKKIGFPTKIFNISKKYKIEKINKIFLAKETSEPVIIKQDPKIKPKATIVSPASAPKLFKNRFQNRYRAFKTIYINFRIQFVDQMLEVRNKNRLESFNIVNEAYKTDALMLNDRKDRMNRLVIELKQKIHENNERLRKEAEERAKQEEARILAERQSQMWRNSKPNVQPQDNGYKVKGLEELASSNKKLNDSKQKTPGVYVPPVLLNANLSSVQTKTSYNRTSKTSNSNWIEEKKAKKSMEGNEK